MPYQALILIVCSGNICRSPMAEHLLRRLIARHGDAGNLRVASAGTWCVPDQPVSAEALQLLLPEGLDLSGHRSRMLTQRDIDKADLILTMTQEQKQDILTRFARAEGKLYLLSEMVDQVYDIEDPYGGTRFEYAYCKEIIEALLTEGYPQIVERALRPKRPAAEQQRKNPRFRWRKRLTPDKNEPA